MKKYTAEDIVMNLVCNGGDCRSKALEAIQAARKGNFEQADALMAQAQQSMHLAQVIHTTVVVGAMQNMTKQLKQLHQQMLAMNKPVGMISKKQSRSSLMIWVSFRCTKKQKVT